jgi:hypothetical protein
MKTLRNAAAAPRRTTLAALAVTALAASLLAGGAAWADPVCQAIHGRVDLAASEPTCGSATGLCATGILHGTIHGNSEFVGTSAVPTVNTPATGVLVLTGDNTIHTSDGDLFTKDSIVLDTAGDGEFAEVDTIVGGTGELAGATGYLVATGSFANGGGVGVYYGKLCR